MRPDGSLSMTSKTMFQQTPLQQLSWVRNGGNTRPGATLRMTGGPRGWIPWARSASGMEHRWLLSSACSNWHMQPDGAQSWTSKTSCCENTNTWRDTAINERTPLVGHHMVGAPVSIKHRLLPSSACSHWHIRPDGVQTQTSKTMFQRTHHQQLSCVRNGENTKSVKIQFMCDLLVHVAKSWFLCPICRAPATFHPLSPHNNCFKGATNYFVVIIVTERLVNIQSRWRIRRFLRDGVFWRFTTSSLSPLHCGCTGYIYFPVISAQRFVALNHGWMFPPQFYVTLNPGCFFSPNANSI